MVILILGDIHIILLVFERFHVNFGFSLLKFMIILYPEYVKGDKGVNKCLITGLNCFDFRRNNVRTVSVDTRGDTSKLRTGSQDIFFWFSKSSILEFLNSKRFWILTLSILFRNAFKLCERIFYQTLNLLFFLLYFQNN